MILWCPNKYGQLKEVPKGIDGIVIDHSQESKDFYDKHKAELPNSVLMIGENWSQFFIDKYSEIQKYYIDEPVLRGYKKEYLDKWSMNGKTVFGEPDKDYLLKYKNVNCQVTFSAYHDYIKIPFINLRIPLWWTDQRCIWDWAGQTFKKKFSVGWINLTKNNNVKELIQSCKYRGIESWLYVEFDLDVEQFLIKTKGIL